MFDAEITLKALVSLIVLSSPFDPIKVLFFNNAITDPPRDRVKSAAQVAFYVALIIGTTALLGRQFFDLLGIDLDVFGVIGGLLIAAMGAEMLFGGGGTGPQGKQTIEDGPGDDDKLMIPLAFPLISGPGTIAVTIGISSQGGNNEGMLAALIAGAVIALITLVSFAVLGRTIAKIKAGSMAAFTRLGGLLLATIGVQMALTGLKNFFA